MKLETTYNTEVPSDLSPKKQRVATEAIERTDLGEGFGMSNTSGSYLKRVDLRPDQVEGKYLVTKTQENFSLLRSKNPHLATVYSNLMATQRMKVPSLDSVRIVDDNIKNNAHFDHAAISRKGASPEVHFNLSNIDTYHEPALNFVLKRIAIEVGAREEDVMKNQKLVSTFIFLHELGHANDYMQNFLRPMYGKLGTLPMNKIISKAAENANRDRLRDMMTLPIPGNIEIDNGKEFDRFKPRLKSMGINNRVEYNRASERAYREMRSEKYADDFATKYIMEHYGDYFLMPGEKGDGSGRVKTGELVEMNNDFAELLGMKEGKFLSFEKIYPVEQTSGVPYKYKREGFLSENVARGNEIQLGDGNPDHIRTILTTPVSKVKRRVVKNIHGVYENQIYVSTQSGSVYKLAVDSRKQPSEVGFPDAQELNRALNLGIGSEVQLLKRRIHENVMTTVDEGQLISGQLKRQIAKGEAIMLSGGSNTTPIRRVYRQWKTWFVETGTSTYEILPVADVKR